MSDSIAREVAKKIQKAQQEYDHGSFPLAQSVVADLIAEEYKPLREQAEKLAPVVEALRRIVESANNLNEPGKSWVVIAGGLIDAAESILKDMEG